MDGPAIIYLAGLVFSEALRLPQRIGSAPQSAPARAIAPRERGPWGPAEEAGATAAR